MNKEMEEKRAEFIRESMKFDNHICCMSACHYEEGLEYGWDTCYEEMEAKLEIAKEAIEYAVKHLQGKTTRRPVWKLLNEALEKLK